MCVSFLWLQTGPLGGASCPYLCYKVSVYWCLDSREATMDAGHVVRVACAVCVAQAAFPSAQAQAAGSWGVVGFVKCRCGTIWGHKEVPYAFRA